MAAASVRDMALRSAASRFLSAANDLHRAALALHLDPLEDSQLSGGSGHENIAAVAGRVVSAVQPFLDPVVAADPLPHACRKLGQDLLIRVARVESAGPGGEEIDPSRLRALWPWSDVEALGGRLSDLWRDWHDDLVLIGETDSLGVPLGQLSISPGASLANAIDQDGTDEPKETVPGSAKDEPEQTVGPRAGLVLNSPRPQQYAPTGILNEFILDSLAYKSMHNREEEVTKAHSDTLEWIFNQSPSKDHSRDRFSHQFTSWLSSSSLGPIYWVTGKPGSGKSTFMRFLFQHGSTMDCLRTWAGDSPVVKAGFFFWTSGSREQRSQTGLLRYLLHQLLSANPDFIPEAFKEMWEKLCIMTTKERIKLTLDWTATELMDAFRALLDAALPHMKICLFVDGLDEFEGDHLAIINLFKGFAFGKHGDNIKMCLSSRPWAVFKNAFQHAVPNLKLQDLTHDDMYRYAKDRLRENIHVQQLLERDGGFEGSLIEETVQRADGVFLWVRLAVDQMLDSFQASSTAEELVATLQSLPPELDSLFAKFFFEDQHESEIAETAILYQLIRARELVADFLKDESSNSLTLWEIAFALDEADDALAIESAVERATGSAIRSRCEATVDIIRQRFAGLLDLHGSRIHGDLRVPVFEDDSRAINFARLIADNRVTYIHRTVRDWLTEAPGISERLTAAAPPAFDAHLRLLRSYVLRLKQPLGRIEHHRRLDEWYSDVALAMTHARYIVHDPKGIQRALVNEIDHTVSWYWLPKPQDPYDHWARTAFGAFEIRMRRPPIWQPFLALAIKFGLTEYAREEVAARAAENVTEEQLELETEDSTPLLAYATEFLCSRNKSIFPLSDPRLVDYLLRNPSRRNPGANHPYTDFNTGTPRTPWIALLRHLRDAKRRGWIEYYDLDPNGTARWVEIIRLFLEVGGADIDATVVKDSWDPEISAIGVIEMLEKTFGAVEVKEVRELMIHVQSSGRA